VSRGNFRQSQQIKSKPVITGSLFQTTKEDIFGVKIPVESLDKARWFYVEIIGLKIKKQSQEAIIFEKGLVLVPNSYSVKNMNGTEFHALLYIEVTDIQSKYNLIKNAGLKIISPIRPWGESNRLFFRCSDPEGNILELFQAADMGMR
jgi:predicted enzyme related to lactoylglutathione lyase